jgi:hypothetical protein
MTGSISASLMPSRRETRASGQDRKKKAVASRSSIRARCKPRQTQAWVSYSELSVGRKWSNNHGGCYMY